MSAPQDPKDPKGTAQALTPEDVSADEARERAIDAQVAPLAELAAVVFSGRPERILQLALAQEPPEVQAGVAVTADALATLALSATPITPSAGLRARLMRTLAARNAPKRKAFVVLDMIKEHLTPGMPLEVPRARAIVPALSARLEEARREGMPIVYLVDEHDPSDDDLDAVEGWGAHAIKGTSGTDVWPELAPKPGDHIVHKATYSSFTDSTFAAVLDALKVDTIVLTGCLTELGLLATATDALQRGFVVEVPPDSQAGANPMTEMVAMSVLSIMPPYGPARKARLAAIGA